MVDAVKIPKLIYSIKANVAFVLATVFFMMMFVIVYTPFYGANSQVEEGYIQMIHVWYEHRALCLPICAAISLLCITLSRMLLLLLTHTKRIYEYEYFLWQIAEVSATALFCNLFLSLYMHYGYFDNLLVVLLIYISIVIFPYTIYWLLVERIDRDKRIASAQLTIMRLRQGLESSNVAPVKFVDENGKVRLVVSADKIVAIHAAGNYVDIVYLLDGKPTRYSLRNSLLGVHKMCSNSLVRCHRSYYVNINHIHLLQRTSDGLFAKMDVSGVDDIPVSQSYASDVMQKFGELIHSGE